MMTSDSQFRDSDPQRGLAGHGEQQQDLQIVAIWRILFRHGMLISLVSLAGLGLGLGLSLLQQKKYTSTATIEISKRADSPLGGSAGPGGSGDFSTSDELINAMMTEEAELKSATVALSVIEQLNLASVPPFNKVAGAAVAGPAATGQPGYSAQDRMLDLFEARLNVTLVKDTRLIQVGYSDSDPERAALIANAVVDNYVRLYSQARSAASAKESAFLSGQLADLRLQVLDSEKRVDDYEKATGIVGPTQEVGGSQDAATTDSVIVNRFIDLNRDLTAAEVTLNQKRTMYEATNGQDANVLLGMASGGSNSLMAESADLGLLNSLNQQRSELRLQVASRSITYGPKSPEMEKLQTQTKEIDVQILAEIMRIHRLARADYDLAAANVAGLRKLVDEQKQQVSTLNVGSNQLLLLQQEAKSKRSLYQELFAKYQEANVSTAVNATHITLVDPARPADRPSSPKTLRNMATGLVTGILLGVFLAFVLDLSEGKGASVSHAKLQPSLLLMLILISLGATSLSAQGFPQIPANLEQNQPLQRRTPTAASSALTAVPEDFSKAPLEPGYLLDMQVYGVPELSSTLRVDDKGTLTVPMLGPISVEGMSVTDAQTAIAKGLQAAELLNHPQVTLNVLQYATGNVTVLGEVQNPGRVSMLMPHSLEEVLALVGGETTAAGDSIEIERPGQPTMYVHYSQGGSAENLARFEVQRSDTIYVRRAGVIYVLGAVNRPGGYLMVNHGKLNVLQAVSLAQGSTLVAKGGKLYVIRSQENGSVRQIQVAYHDMVVGKKPPMELEVNDILYVPTSTAKSILLNGAGLIGTAATAAIYRTP